MVTQEEVIVILNQAWQRFIDMVLIPADRPEMLWSIVPLIIALIFMTMYFGRYKQESLGWNTAFGNTMVFLFVALNLIKEMYYDAGISTIDGFLANPFHLFLSLGLAGASFLLMLITYFHKIPERVAFFLFSAPPLNVTIYVIMAMVYADVPADFLTLLAAIILLIVIMILTKLIKIVVYMIMGYHETLGITAQDMGIPSQEHGRVEKKSHKHPEESKGKKIPSLKM
ncbi:MAG: hypothetical protein ABII71_05915 [Candidatus Micrarchaeota archaeon]